MAARAHTRTLKEEELLVKTTHAVLGAAIMVCASAALASAQQTAPTIQPTANPLVDTARAAYGTLKTNLIKSAEKMPDEAYAFSPTPEVRTFGQLIGHVANAQYSTCAAAAGEKNPSTVNIEKTMTAKADLVKALTDAVAYCDSVYAKTDDKKGLELVTLRTSSQPRVAVLFYNNSHSNEHYGNLVTYMRIKGIVPPSSEPR